MKISPGSIKKLKQFGIIIALLLLTLVISQFIYLKIVFNKM